MTLIHRWLVAQSLCLLLPLLAPAATPATPTPSFEDFDRRARAGEHLSVVFFGASLTWGANASDPQQTSYRALTARHLEDAYPDAHFRFFDAAIGGTGSQLAVFRLNRDVLAHKPDLVFLDFSANDDIYGADPETLASYESLVRRIILEAHAPVVQVILPFKWTVAQGNFNGMKRRDAHLEISRAYQTAAADAIALGIQRVKSGATTIDRLWPVDGIHPCEEGYAMFADAVWSAYQDAVQRKLTCVAPPKMLHAPTYMHSARVLISSLTPLPKGWQPGKPHLVSAYFDMLMSRWLDDETVVTRFQQTTGADGQPHPGPPQVIEPLKVRFKGQMVLLWGESTPTSAKYRVTVDGKLVTIKSAPALFDAGVLARQAHGNGHLCQLIATGLDPAVEHTLEIEPVFTVDTDQELRFESICVAGDQAGVWPAP